MFWYIINAQIKNEISIWLIDEWEQKEYYCEKINRVQV